MINNRYVNTHSGHAVACLFLFYLSRPMVVRSNKALMSAFRSIIKMAAFADCIINIAEILYLGKLDIGY